MRLLIFLSVISTSVLAQEAPCPDYDPLEDSPKLIAQDKNVAIRTFQEGRSSGYGVGARVKSFLWGITKQCLIVERTAKYASDLHNMNVGGLGYGLKVATNKDPFEAERYNQITWVLPTVKNCNYEIFITYASAEKRRAKLTIDGKIHDEKILPNATGGFCPSNKSIVKVANFKATKEETIFTISSTNKEIKKRPSVPVKEVITPLPNIHAIKLSPQ